MIENPNFTLMGNIMLIQATKPTPRIKQNIISAIFFSKNIMFYDSFF